MCVCVCVCVCGYTYIYIYIYVVSPQDLCLQPAYHFMLFHTYVYASHKYRDHGEYRYNRRHSRIHTTVLLRILFRYIDKSAADFRQTKIALQVLGKPQLLEGIARHLLWYSNHRVFCMLFRL